MPPPHNPNVPHHDIDDEAEMRHHDIEYRPNRNRRALTARCGRNEHSPPDEPRQPAAWSASGAETDGAVSA